MLQQFYPTPPHDYRYELNKDMHFAAAHFIPDPSAGVCQRMHGHTYFANITIVGDELDHVGFLIDFKQLKDLVHGVYDHSVMNDHADFQGEQFPTTERVAAQIWQNIQRALAELPHRPKCFQVLVRETSTSYVRYVPTASDFS